MTRIVKFDWQPSQGGVAFAATTTVPGTILNQFSLDEHGDYLRIATTVSNSYSGNWTGRAENTLLVLSEDEGVMEFVGSLHNLALDETMRSVRFLGDRAFVTTFRTVDPLFAVDLSEAAEPRPVGHITLPGYTSYMHLVDEDHLLTVGRNTPDGRSGPTQVALFDIADLEQPRRVAEYTFPRFSSSEAELDHHAFGYYAQHGLLGMPIAQQFIERVDEDGDGYREATRWVREDALAVFSVSPDAPAVAERLELVGEIGHDSPVRRSGYIGDFLYSIAGDSVKSASVADPATVIAALDIRPPEEDPEEPPVVPELVGRPFFDFTAAAIETDYPATQENAAYLETIERARSHLAADLGLPARAPLLVTTETSSAEHGGGLAILFRVDAQMYLYRANEDGLVQQAEAGFEFTELNVAWHSLAGITAPAPASIAGDYDRDADVDGADFLAWQRSFGSTTELASDGNNDGRVTQDDLSVWDSRYGTVDRLSAAAGNFDADANVDGADFLTWQLSFASTIDLAADANQDGLVDAADLAVWEAAFSGHAAARGAISLEALEDGLLFAAGAWASPFDASFAADDQHASAAATSALDSGIYPDDGPGVDLGQFDPTGHKSPQPQQTRTADEPRDASTSDEVTIDSALALW